MSSILFRIHSFCWSEIASIAGKIVPPLHGNLFKGQMGRIGVVGGSEHYSGAPYYSAQTTLNFGADLAFIFCSKSASSSIKSYSPELMVVPFYSDLENPFSFPNAIVSSLHRLDTLVIGPGLGRDESVIEHVKGVITETKSRNIPLVIDADGLFILNKDPWLVRGYTRCILTPNHAEFSRLVEAIKTRLTTTDSTDNINSTYLITELSSNILARQVRAICRALQGVTVVCKGVEDIISAGEDVYVLKESGSPRRCGGQGDILSGALAVAMTWGLKRVEHLTPLPSFITQDTMQMPEVHLNVEISGSGLSADSFAISSADITQETGDALDIRETQSESTIYAAIFACSVTRRAGALAFAAKGRAMGSPDVMREIGRAFVELYPEG